jgi:hypothetical protein
MRKARCGYRLLLLAIFLMSVTPLDAGRRLVTDVDGELAKPADRLATLCSPSL